MSNSLTRRRPDAAFVVRIIGIVLFAYFFFGAVSEHADQHLHHQERRR